MSMIEFQTYVQQGTIQIPLPYREGLTGRVRVIILRDEQEQTHDMIEYLLDHPYQVQDFIPYTREQIYE